MTHFIVKYEAVDVIAESREEAIEKVKGICPDISSIDVAGITVERQKDKHQYPLHSV